MEKFPQAFKDRIHKILPEAEWDDFFAFATEPLPKVIRTAKPVNRSDWDLSKTVIPEAFFVDRDNQKERPLGKTLEHFTGQIYSQSLSSMLPVQVLDPRPGERILDMCAAPGSKTTFCAQRMKNTGLLIANEPSGTRSKKLVANLNRLGVQNAVLLQSDGTLLDHFLEPIFDKVLLDAPCSSEGFGRRDAKFFSTMWSENSITEMSKLQKRLIVSGFNLLNVGGTMTYSTCTSAPEENEVVVQHLLDTFPGAIKIRPIKIDEVPFRGGLANWKGQDFDPTIIENVCRLYPHLRTEQWNSESFFVCKIEKLSPTPPLKKKPITQSTNHKFLKKNTQTEISTRLLKRFGLPKGWLGDGVLMEKSGDIYACTKPMNSFCNSFLWRRAGLKILDKDQNITNEFVSKFGDLATQNIYELPANQLKRWLAGYDITTEDPITRSSDQLIVKYQNHCVGWGKVVNAKIKNKLPRDRVFDY